MSTNIVKERPILFSGEMVRAILAGRKTQTRRAVKGAWHEPEGYLQSEPTGDDGAWYFSCAKVPASFITRCPYGQPGDRLWVRETFAYGYNDDGSTWQEFRADKEHPSAGKWRPSIHMPRWACRLTLRIKSVRVERLQDITAEDAAEEGVQYPVRPAPGQPGMVCPLIPISDPVKMKFWPKHISHDSLMRATYAALWESINGAGSWAANPWVWVIEFEREASV